MLPFCGPFLEEGGGGRGAGEERDRRREMERSNWLPDWLGRPGWLPGLPDLAGLARLAWLAGWPCLASLARLAGSPRLAGWPS